MPSLPAKDPKESDLFLPELDSPRATITANDKPRDVEKGDGDEGVKKKGAEWGN